MGKIREFFKGLFSSKPTVIPSDVKEEFDKDFEELYGDSAEKNFRKYSDEYRKKLREALDKVEPYPILAGLIRLQEGTIEILIEPICDCQDGPLFHELLKAYANDEDLKHTCTKTKCAFAELKSWDKEALQEALRCAMMIRDKDENLKKRLVEVLILMRNYGVDSKKVRRYIKSTRQELGEEAQEFLELTAILAYLIKA